LSSYIDSKGPGAGRSSQNPDCQSSQVPRKGFPSKVPKTGSQAKFPSQVPKGSQEEVPKQGFQEQVPKGSQAKFPGTGSQRFPKVPTKRFPSKVLKSRFPSKVPRQGSQEQVPKSRFASKVTKQGFPSKAPWNRFASKVSRHRCPNKVFVVPDRWSYLGLSETALKHHSNKHVLTFSCSCCCWGFSLGLFFLLKFLPSTVSWLIIITLW